MHVLCIIMQSAYVNPSLSSGSRFLAQKTERHAAVLELIGAHLVGSQEELRKLLGKRGIEVTQATLSRDLRELGVVRVPGEDGARYALPETVVGEAIPAVETLLPRFFSSIDGVGELIVLKTLASGAQPAGSPNWPARGRAFNERLTQPENVFNYAAF
jgi:transcriptional regulator of arginine metabolism